MIKAELEKYVGKKVKIRFVPSGALTDGIRFTGTLGKITDCIYEITADEGQFYFIEKKDYLIFDNSYVTDCEPINENDADYKSER